MQEYIRIDEAVRKYGKTRQTFYNYINKGMLEVKKINNRLFLDTHAIENLMNTIIEEPSHVQEQHVQENNTGVFNRITQQLDIIEDMIATNYQTNIQQLQDNMIYKIQNVKQEILYDLKNLFGVQLNHILNNQLNYSLKFEHLDNKLHSFNKYIQKLEQQNKKMLFYGSVITILIINYIITSLLR